MVRMSSRPYLTRLEQTPMTTKQHTMVQCQLVIFKNRGSGAALGYSVIEHEGQESERLRIRLQLPITTQSLTDLISTLKHVEEYIANHDSGSSCKQETSEPTSQTPFSL